jgi:N-acyl-D-amino-acid deacylase
VTFDFDLAVRGGSVVDGTGAARFRADVGVRDGVIVEVGTLSGSAATEIDASGGYVTPGFIDPHTHLDAQLCWDPAARPSSLHGVTTVVVGLCGFGVAPCPPDGRDYLLRSLEVVEEIPYESTVRGVPFGWSSWIEYFDYVGRQPLGVNVAGFVPHSALRYHVMGDRARGEAATVADRTALAAELSASLAAGAVGFATSRGPNHVDAFGEPVPSRFADDDELRALVGACGGRVWQINVETKFSGDADGLIAEVDQYAAWSEAAGARLSWTPLHAEPGTTVWREVMARNEVLNERRDLVVAPQVAASPITTVFRFDEFSYLAFVPGWRALTDGFYDLSEGDKLARLRDPDVRARLRAAPVDPTVMFTPDLSSWIVLSSPARPESEGRSVQDLSVERGGHPVDVLCDLVAADQLRTLIQVPAVNRDHEAAATLIRDSHTLLGLGDAGAHVRTINNFSYPTQLLAVFVRDEGHIDLETAINRLTDRPAHVLGLPNRGRIQVGRAADLVVVDLDALDLGPIRISHDLPGGAPRIVQDAHGYRAIAVNGVVTLEDDEPTGPAPGELVRSVAR